MRNLLVLLALFALVAMGCTKDSGGKESRNSGGSGGGSSGGSAISFEGNWSGTLNKVSDNCVGLPDSDRIKVEHRVDQDGNDITLTITGGSYIGSGFTHVGSPTGSDQFAVSADLENTFGGCKGSNAFSYDKVTASQAQVTRILTEDCGSLLKCVATYTGTVTR